MRHDLSARPDPAGPPAAAPAGPAAAVLAIIVSYNTRALTLDAAASVLAQQVPGGVRLVVVDNASSDGSAAALAAAAPQAALIASAENLGFGRAVNLAAAQAPSRWIALVNPDAALRPGALATLLAFAEAHPGPGIYGGRTVDPDGRTDPDCCRGHTTPWSMACMALGLSRAFPGSALFNSEGLGAWPRDSVRAVDMVIGCFCLIERTLWDRLGGFDERYWLYGEDADLCLRATALTGQRPLFTPDAVARHVSGAASDSPARHRILLARGRMTVMRQHWPARWRWLAGPLGLLWSGLRAGTETAAHGLARLGGRPRPDPPVWRAVWAARADWLPGW